MAESVETHRNTQFLGQVKSNVAFCPLWGCTASPELRKPLLPPACPATYNMSWTGKAGNQKRRTTWVIFGLSSGYICGLILWNSEAPRLTPFPVLLMSGPSQNSVKHGKNCQKCQVHTQQSQSECRSRHAWPGKGAHLAQGQTTKPQIHKDMLQNNESYWGADGYLYTTQRNLGLPNIQQLPARDQ